MEFKPIFLGFAEPVSWFTGAAGVCRVAGVAGGDRQRASILSDYVNIWENAGLGDSPSWDALEPA
jgi:hypothetical protein